MIKFRLFQEAKLHTELPSHQPKKAHAPKSLPPLPSSWEPRSGDYGTVQHGYALTTHYTNGSVIRSA